MISSAQSQNEKLNTLLQSDASSFLRSIRTELSNLLESTDESLRQKLGEVYAAATVLSLDKDQWQTFCEQQEWETFRQRPKPIDAHRQNALRYAVRYAVGFDGASSNNAAYRYKKALEGCWVQKVAPIDVPKLIKEAGGIEKLKRQNVQRAGELTVRFSSNGFTKTIQKSSFQFDALLLVRFAETESGDRLATILEGDARKGAIPLMKRFERKVDRWCAKQKQSRTP